MRKKDLFSIIYISVLTLIAMVYGFTSIPSPIEQRQLTLDHRRVSDLGEIKSSIENYYANHKRLPSSLDELPSNRSMHKTDPETNQPYEYHVLYELPPYIQLCANFTTDSHKDDPDEADRSSYSWSVYSGDYQHPKGHHCFKLNISYYAPTPTTATISATPTQAVPKSPFSDYPPKRESQ